MKTTLHYLLLIACSCTRLQSAAQDSSVHSASKPFLKTSEQTDNINGRKIQQQSLFSGRIEKPLSETPASRRKKNLPKKKHLHPGTTSH